MADRIDLHMHSTSSDGTDSPAQILQKARQCGLTAFALTDHDTCRGAAKIMKLRGSGDPGFIPGVEFSCEDHLGKCHLLGYRINPEGGEVCRLTATTHRRRMKKLDIRLEQLRRKFGFKFTEDEIETLEQCSNPGKPHIGNLLVRKGYASSLGEAIEKYLNGIRTGVKTLSAAEAVRAIAADGGIPVLAHPVFGSGSSHLGEDVLRERIRHLMDEGLMGIEAFYCTYTEEDRKMVLSLAEEFDLLCTAGSDYHGTNKPNPMGSTGLEKATEEERARVERFLSLCRE